MLLNGVNVVTVSQLNQYIKKKLETDNTLSGLFVRGEISNFKLHSSGHMYFTLKDENSVIRSVMFKGKAMSLRFIPNNGMKVIANGYLGVFERNGDYQLYCEDLIPDGVGALFVAFEQLKEKLSQEGLFDIKYKKRLPLFPNKIAIITSPTGAAIRDMLRILKARWPITEVLVVPVHVQGESAAGEIAKGIEYVNTRSDIDLIITGRGGGSIEDLWAFNEEIVARAIFASKIPIISAVGHEPDVTISDFVADLRAATPSNAAELAVPDHNEVILDIKHRETRVIQAVLGTIKLSRDKLDSYKRTRSLVNPLNYLSDKKMLVDIQEKNLNSVVTLRLNNFKREFQKYAVSLDAMSPLKVLNRGYSITKDLQGNVVKNVSKLKVNDRISIDMVDGTVNCDVIDIKKEVKYE